MAYDVKFKKGLQSGYDALSTKDSGTFYIVTDTPAIYLGSVKLTSVSELSAALSRITANEGNISKIISGLNGFDLTSQGSVKTFIQGVETTIDGHIGDLSDLDTTDKTNIVSAINEIQGSISDIVSNSITIVHEDTPTAGYASTYTFKAGNVTIGKIDIPKDLVVQSGEIVQATPSNPIHNKTSGEFIKLVIANQAEPLYIDATSLVDVYTAQQGATQVQVSVVSGVIGASIVAGSITATELASDSVLTVKIKDKNVTTAKLADGAVTNDKLDSSLKSAISKANSSVQSVTQGSDNGTISVDGTDVAVKGLGSAAYTDSGAYDVAGAASSVQNTVTGTSSSAAGSLNLNGLKKSITALESAVGSGGDIDTRISDAIDALDVSDTAVSGKYISQVSETNGKISVTRADLPDYSNTYDAKGSANTALNSAKSYTDTALTWGSF